MADAFEAWGRAIVRYRWLALLVSLALTALAVGATWQRVRVELPVDFTPQALFMDEGPTLTRLQEIEQVFGREDNDVVLLLQGPIGTHQGVAALRGLHAVVEAAADVERVDSLVNAPLAVGEEGLLRIVEPLRAWPPAEAIERARHDPALRNLLIGEHGDLAALRVRVDRDKERVAELAPAIDGILQAARGVPLPEGFSLVVTGVPFIRTEVVDMMIADELTFLPIVASIFALATLVLFRRFWSGIAPLAVSLVGNIWAMGVLLATGAVLNVLSILVPILVVVIGVSDGVHILARYREELEPPDPPPGAPPVSREEAMGRTMRAMTVATFLTTFTTAAGFASLLVARTTVIRDFGVHCALAVTISWLAVMLVLPTWLAFVPRHRVGPRLSTGQGRKLFAALDRLTRRHPRRVVAWSLLLLATAAAVGSGVRSQSHILEMYPESHPTWQAVHLVDTRMGGIVPVFVHIELSDVDIAEPLLDPALLKPMATLQDELLARPEVRWASSPASWVRHLHFLLTGDAVVPDTRAAVAQELLLAELAGDLPLDTVMGPYRERGRILMLTQDAGGRELLELQAHARQRAETLFAGTGARIDVTGDGFIASSGIRGLVDDLVNSVGVVLVVILLTLWALLRDLRLAMISTLPNVVPLVFTLATLGLMGSDIQVTNIVSFTVAIGLAVDDTIHFVVRYREERQAGVDHPLAMSRTFQGAGRAIMLTSLLLVAGFGVMSFSELTSTRFFGILSAVTLTAAVFADLVLLPALLNLTARVSPPAAARPR